MCAMTCSHQQRSAARVPAALCQDCCMHICDFNCLAQLPVVTASSHISTHFCHWQSTTNGDRYAHLHCEHPMYKAADTNVKLSCLTCCAMLPVRWGSQYPFLPLSQYPSPSQSGMKANFSVGTLSATAALLAFSGSGQRGRSGVSACSCCRKSVEYAPRSGGYH